MRQTPPDPLDDGRRSRPWTVAAGAVAIAIAAFAVATLAIALVGTTVADRLGSAPTTARPGAEPAAAAGDHRHGDAAAPSRALRPDELEALEGELDAARSALPGATVADALASGYQVTNTIEGADDVHLLRPDFDDGTFAPDRPSQMLVSSRQPQGEVLAVTYLVETSSSVPPEGFTGPLDQWHHHQGTVCVMPAGSRTSTPRDEASCRSAGGTWRPFAAWMLHLWIVPGVGNPDGVFTATNPCLAERASCPSTSELVPG